MGIIALCLYAAALFHMTWRIRRQGDTVASFFINDRSSGALEVGLSIIVSCVGASATMGVVGMAFTVGTPAVWWLGMGACGLLALSLFLAKKVRASQALTMPQLVETYLGAPARPIIAAVIVISWVAILAAQYAALVRVVQELTAFGPTASLAVSILLIVAHTLGGGQAAVMRMDRIQAFVILAGLAATGMWLTGANPTWPSKVSLELVNSQFPVGRLWYYGCIIGGSYLICPMLFGRLLCARGTRAARKGGVIAAGGLLLFALLIVAVGLACRGLVPEGTPADAVLTTALSALPPWLYLGMLLALLSAILSSADSCLITAGTVCSHDLLRRADTTACRWCVLALGVLGAAMSHMDKSILGFLLLSYDVYVCGVVVPVCIGMLAHGKYRVSPAFACAAVCLGGVLGGVSGFTETTAWSYAGLGTAAVATLAGLRPKASPGRPAPGPEWTSPDLDPVES
ncbi:MAG: sodium:solute symporter [Desulfovibrionaceae bacterium]